MSSNSSGRRLEGFLAGKGFYIVLFLCAAVIGLSAWMMTAGNETMEDLTNSSGVSMEQRRVETILITPDVKPPMRETMAEDAAPAVGAEAQEEDEAVPVWTEAAPEPAAPAMYWPVEGELERLHDIEHLHYDVTLRDWRTHEGVDILAPLGETVCAAMSGTVMAIEDDSLYGTVVTVDHGDGTSALYANLASLPAVSVGDHVEAGEVLGSVGTTALCEIGQGTHLHFAMYLDGASVDPLDYLPA